MRSKMVAEFIGTFALVFFGCGAILQGRADVPYVFGLVVAVMIYSVGHVSGAHFNPAVTLAFAVARHFPLKSVPFYWLAQFLGAIAAMALVRSLVESSAIATPVPTVGIVTSLIWETSLSFFLMFVIVAVATDSRAVGMMAGLAIGGIVALGALLGGAAMNPARALAPALLEGRLAEVWIYLAGPSVGAILGAVTYEWIRCHDGDGAEEDRSPAEGCC